MDFSLSEERQMLADTASRYVRNQYAIEVRHKHAAMDGGYDPKTWQELADLGLIGALISPDMGGFGGLGEDIAVVFEALGRGLVVEPFLATGVLGASPIAIAGTDTQKALLEEVIAGKVTLALAHGEPEGRYTTAYVKTTAKPDGNGWVIDGRKAVVLNGDTADKLVVSARISGDDEDEDGIALFLVDGNAVGVSRRGYGTIDGGRAAEISLAGVKAGNDALIGEAGKAYGILEETMSRGIVALSAEALGAMEVCRDMTLEYLKTRKQFGRTIGSFQVLQHRMADMCLEIEQVRALLMLAAGTLESNRRERELNTAGLKNLVGRGGRLVAEESIQLHGGIAMTWEYACPHFAKRLIMIDHLLGDTDYHLERYTRLSREAA